MRTILLTTLVLLPMPVASAAAHPATLGFENLARAAMASVIVPPEWDGVWTVVDSVYHCEGGFITTGAGTDSICEGKDFSLVRGSIALTCAGTADATTLDETCTGSGPDGTDCIVSETVAIHGTHTDDSYFLVFTFNFTWTGTGCGGAIPQCIQENRYGTRTGGAPADFCATPTKPSSWGRIKARYR